MYKSIGVRKHSTSENGKHLGKEVVGTVLGNGREEVKSYQGQLGEGQYTPQRIRLCPPHMWGPWESLWLSLSVVMT